jgi:hypothetical protein
MPYSRYDYSRYDGSHNLASITVHQILESRDTPDEFMTLFESSSDVLEGLKSMMERGLLGCDDSYYQIDNDTHFFLTDEGILKTRKLWVKLPKLLDEKPFDSWITAVLSGGTSSTSSTTSTSPPPNNSQKNNASVIDSMKGLVTGLREKFNNRIQDEIVDTTVTAAKQHGSRALYLIIHYILDNTKSGS